MGPINDSCHFRISLDERDTEVIELRRLWDFGEERRESVLVEIVGELVEDLFETLGHIDLLFLSTSKGYSSGCRAYGRPHPRQSRS
jgi:hypothetical protein